MYKPACCFSMILFGIFATSGTSISLQNLMYEEAQRPEFLNKLKEWRRELHTMPELSFLEFNTSIYIRNQLDEIGIPYEYPFGTTGIRAGPIGGPQLLANADSNTTASPLPIIALRADMDGLPITEEVDVPYKSATPGRMHACGHDAHMAMLLGAAWLLKSHEAELPGGVVLLFQPAEEGLGGARNLVQEGALRGVGALHGLHVWPDMPAGSIGSRPGTIMAASDRFSFRVVGAGGHGAMPHTTRDPVLAAAAIVMGLQGLVARETSPLDSAVVTVSRVNTGPGAANVIPDAVELSGTVRALTPPIFARLHTRVEEVAAGVAAAYGCRVDNVSWSAVPYPPTQNDPVLSALVLEVAASVLGKRPSVEMPGAEGVGSASAPPSAGASASGQAVVVEPSMAAEDFSFYGQAVPQTAFTFLGIGDATKGTNVGLHSPRFRMDEDQMPLGALLHATMAVEWLQRQEAAAVLGGASRVSAETTVVGGGGKPERIPLSDDGIRGSTVGEPRDEL